ncbi:hypothetical protein HB364_14005 [Pseudoflavitalea sp. X16]|uniref:helix-turn-helix domain-containing protein n=1 Tax=Paraflavitalea devenefica TaxID=2716334 RepID=UPI001423F070|nr:helix-turn-helix domain-containing protein [Paraflavitalea devenefica]NII26203.1 hypothetical protein [Paraflavitalea devenefica]
MKEIVKLFSRNVREYCHQNELSAQDLSKSTAINIEIIEAIWEGKHDPDLEQVGKIAAALNIAPHLLLMDAMQK